MGTRVRITYFGMEGEGATLSGAKAAAGAAIERALGGDYTPIVLAYRGYFAIVAREPRSGWGYRVLQISDVAGPDAVLKHLHLSDLGYRDDLPGLLRGLRRHLAQCGWDGTEADQAPVIEDAGDRRDFESWMKWQYTYKRARAGGADEKAAREQADEARVERRPAAAHP